MAFGVKLRVGCPRDLFELFGAQVLDAFSAFAKLFVEACRHLLHAFVGLLGAAEEMVVLTARDARMAVVAVKAKSKKAGS